MHENDWKRIAQEWKRIAQEWKRIAAERGEMIVDLRALADRAYLALLDHDLELAKNHLRQMRGPNVP